MTSIKDFKKRFDKKLESFFIQKQKTLKKEVDDSVILSAFEQAMRITQDGGKRIRPYLAWLMYKASGGKDHERVWHVLIGIELFHAFALIHDDIMDKGALRHGMPTVHNSIEKQLLKEKRIGKSQHIAISQAILVGDLFYAWSAEMVAQGGPKVMQVFFEMNQEVMLGQMLDVDGMSRKTITSKQLLAKTNKKTAGYTFVQPLRIGWTLAGSPKALKNIPEQFGRSVGIAFQIQDDYLDLTGTAKQLGKLPFSDIRDGQHTFFTQHLLQHGTKKHIRELNNIFRTQVTEKDSKAILALFDESGAFEYGLKEMNRFFQQARSSIETVSMSIEDKQAFIELYETICSRTH